MKRTLPIAGLSKLILLIWLSAGICAQAAVRFYALGDLPGGTYDSTAMAVSADGSTVVGFSNSTNSQFEAFRWTKATGLQTLPNLPSGSVLRGASASTDLLRIAANVEGTSEGALWTAGVGAVSVGDLPGGGALTFVGGISPDGTAVVGASNSTNGREAFRWTAAGGIQGLGDLPGGDFFSQANDASSDGSIVIGVSSSASGTEAFIWKQNTNSISGLGDLPDGAFSSWANAVSANGAVVVGTSASGSGSEAFRWTPALGMQGLGDLPGGTFSSFASNVSSDGSLIVGYATSSIGAQAVLWKSGSPVQIIQDMVAAKGLSLPGWTLSFAHGISDNGRHIVGSGLNPGGNYEAWLVSFLPDPPTITLKSRPRIRAKVSGRFKVIGTAADDAAVVRVEYQINGRGPWKSARGTNVWSVLGKLRQPVRRTRLAIRAVDEDGQKSPAARVILLPAV